MSLRDRALKFEPKRGEESKVQNTIATYNEPRPWGVVDGELVEILSQDSNIPGMSPGFWCRSDEDGTTAPVSFLDVKLYSNRSAADQAIRGGLHTSSGSPRESAGRSQK